jgi:RNA polymerase sigma factor (sigma-70 family)
MASLQKTLEAQTGFLNDDVTWDNLYQRLRPSVRYWVYRHMIPSWLGQEEDIINDIIQEALFRTWKHLQKVQIGEAPAIASLPHFCRTIAMNYATDIQRRERHESRMIDAENTPIGCIIVYELVEDVATNLLSQEELYLVIAEEIKYFPEKQREVLLTDLAQHTDFNGPLTHLQRAFLQNGICLANYQELPQQDAAARNRYWSLLSIAYKRLRITVQLREDQDSQECKNKQRDPKNTRDNAHNILSFS